MGTPIRLVLVAAALLCCGGCSDDDNPVRTYPRQPTPAVRQFIADQDLPDVHDGRQILVSGPVEFFSAEYGSPQDCLSGCFYSSAYGLRYDDHIGWLYFNDYDGYEAPPDAYYDVLPTDEILFDVDYWFTISEANSSTFWQGLLPLLARDPDTGRDSLLNIAVLLYSHIDERLASDLVENPAVGIDAEILTLVSELPVAGEPDRYLEVRNRALELLAALEG